jgi:hypothetical protein
MNSAEKADAGNYLTDLVVKDVLPSNARHFTRDKGNAVSKLRYLKGQQRLRRDSQPFGHLKADPHWEPRQKRKRVWKSSRLAPHLAFIRLSHYTLLLPLENP